MPFSSLDEFRKVVEQQTTQTDGPFDYVEKMLGVLLDQPKVMSYTLHIRDPITGELRLESMKGVQHPEPMDGFLLSVGEEQRLQQINESMAPFGQKKYFPDPRQAKLVGRNRIRPEIQARIRHLVEQRQLTVFGDFVDREGVVSCIRYEHRENDVVSTILFVNFKEEVDWSTEVELDAVLDDAFDRVKSHLEEIISNLGDDNPKAFRQIARILQPIRTLATDPKVAVERKQLEDFFANLLDGAIAALDIDPQEGFGTIHLFDPDSESGDLRLTACTVEQNSLRQVLRAYKGEGVVSWVALNQKPVLINRMAGIFDTIRDRHSGFPDIQSALAVPMLNGQDLVGVMTIESRQPDAFTRQDVHTLLYAANEAALAYRLWKNVETAKKLANRAKRSEERVGKLLSIASDAANAGTRDDTILNKLAPLMKEWLKPDFAEIWMYDSVTETFLHAGASYPEFQRNVPPRNDGTSMFIVETKTPLWIFDVNYENRNYQTEFWNDDTESWVTECPSPPKCCSRLPKKVHDVMRQEKITYELGMPIMSHGRCIGLAWLKYNREDVSKPAQDDMSLIKKLMGEIAMVVDSILQSEKSEEKEVCDEITSQHLTVGPLSSRGMHGHVLYEPSEGKLGGDFFVSTSEEKECWAYLLGDVAGHGYKAALRMLPLITAFRIFQKEGNSPKHVISQLTGVNVNEQEEFGTALCFVYFEQPTDGGDGDERRGDRHVRRYVAASSAGHPSLMVIRDRGATIEDLPKFGGPAFTYPFGVAPVSNFCEECIEVFPGDLLVGYTDGVEEARRPDSNEQFGRDRIAAVVMMNKKKGPEEISREVYNAASEFAKHSWKDDATVVVVRIDPLHPEVIDDRESSAVEDAAHDEAGTGTRPR